ncbi:MAG: DUF92 domain-containing protein [Bacilli bacterium]|nr:DUF92 domain-containing protein [Bacilli bacterium]
MYLEVLLPSILALYALYKKKITLSGVIFAWVLGIIILTWGGYLAFTALALVFLLTIFTDKIKKTKKDKTRDIKQMISNVLTASICIVIYYLTENNIFYIMYYAVIASSLSDTMASSIGTLSKKRPINIFTQKKLKTGEPGGVTLLGLLASLLGGIIIGLIYLFSQLNISNFILISLMGLVGSLFDSILGTLFEGKYICQACGIKTEDKLHCNLPTNLIEGYASIDNNMVNLLNNIFIFILSYILLY